MDSSVSGKDEIWFLRVCHHVPHELYTIETGPHSVHRPAHLLAMRLHNWGFFCYFLCRIVFLKGLEFIPRDKTVVFCNHVPGLLLWKHFSFRHINFISFYLLAPSTTNPFRYIHEHMQAVTEYVHVIFLYIS